MKQSWMACLIILSVASISGCSDEMPEAEQEGSMAYHGDVEGQELIADEGYTQQEQLREVAIVLSAMQEHFGEAHFVDLGSQAGIDDFEAEVRPQDCGDNHYRYRVGFDIEDRDNSELYERAEAVANQLGLSENENNGEGADGGPMLYGAGLDEDRLFSVTTEGGQLSAIYKGRCSDHQTMQDKFQEFADEHAEQMEQNAPTHLPGYGSGE